MSRLQKKCMVFSLCLHGFLLVIVFASAAFRPSPPPSDVQIISMIPANILDQAGVGGGAPVVNLAPQPPAPQHAQPSPPVVPAHTESVEREPQPTPHRHKEATHSQPPPEPKSEESVDVALESKPKATRSSVPSETKARASKHSSQREVQVSYEPANSGTKTTKSDKTASSEPSHQAEAQQPDSRQAGAQRLKAIETSMNELASGVKNSGSPSATVDVQGIGGGEAFAGYKSAVASIYYRAWLTPDNTASRMPTADAKVTIARDGSIVSAELVRSSGDKAVDRSVEKVLQEVTQLPPFPASTHDAQRTYIIQFNLQAKEMSG